MATIRIAVADDHQVVRHGLRLSLELEPDMVVVGEARTGAEVCHRVLLASAKTAVVMLTNYQQDELILRSLLAGAKGYVIKDVDLDELKKMIRSVYRGDPGREPRGGRAGPECHDADDLHSYQPQRVAAPRLFAPDPGGMALGDGPRQ